MRIADVIDHEVQLGRDERAAEAGGSRELLERDAALSARLGLAGLPRGEAVAAWLAALRRRAPLDLFPGARVEAAVRWVRAGLVLAGLALGWGAMTGFLALAPVNVWRYLLLFVFVQLALFAATAAGAAALAARRGPGGPGPLQAALAGAVRRLAGRAFRGGAHAEAWLALGRRLRARRALYARAEPWVLLGLGQSFGVAFNAGAVLGLLGLVVFTQLAFSWQTTLGALDAQRFHAIAEVLAAPWRGLLPDAVPSLEVVEATRNRLDRPDLAGAWWPFMLAALVTYGLLPRIALLLVAWAGGRRALGALPPDDPATEAALQRLGLSGRARALLPGRSPQGGAVVDVVAWRGAPLERAWLGEVARRLGATPGRELEAGGPVWEGHARAVLGDDPARRGLLVVAEAQEAPDKATLRFLREAREVLGRAVHVHVLLSEPSREGPRPPRAASLRTWRARLGALADPYLRLEPLEAPPAPGAEERTP